MRREYHPQLQDQGCKKDQDDARKPDPRGRRIGVVKPPYWNKEVEGEDYYRKCNQTCDRENKNAPPAGLIEIMQEYRVRLAAVLRSHD
jgi:hypothetical protein